MKPVYLNYELPPGIECTHEAIDYFQDFGQSYINNCQQRWKFKYWKPTNFVVNLEQGKSLLVISLIYSEAPKHAKI